MLDFHSQKKIYVFVNFLSLFPISSKTVGMSNKKLAFNDLEINIHFHLDNLFIYVKIYEIRTSLFGNHFGVANIFDVKKKSFVCCI